MYLLSVLRSAPIVMWQVQSRVDKASYNNVYLLSVLRSAPVVMWQVQSRVDKASFKIA